MKRFLIAISIVGPLLAFAAGVAAQVGAEVALRTAMEKETVKGDLKGAIDQYKKLAQSKDRAVAAKALVHMGQCYEKLGDAEARKAYERAVRDYADQAEAVATARARLAALGPPDGGAAGMVTRQIAKVGDRQFLGGISRDGRYTAFNIPNGGVFLFDLRTGEERRLVQRTGEETFWIALISPDGRQVAFARSPNGVAPVVQLVGVDGSTPRTVDLGGEGRGIPWAWTPDGKQLLVVRHGNDLKNLGMAERVLVSVSGDAQTVIGTGGIRGGAGFSPDGSLVAVTEYQPDQKTFAIALLPVRGGGEPVRIAAGASSPAWTPDGARLLFISERNGNWDMFSVRIVGGKPAGALDFVKQGVSAVLGVTAEGDCYHQTTSQIKDLFTAEIDMPTGKLVGKPNQVTSRDVSDGAAWSPNGEYLAYYKRQAASQETKVVIRSMKTGADREVPLKGSLYPHSMKPQWFPDNRSLFVHTWDEKLYRLEIDTGELLPLLGSATLPRYSQRVTDGEETWVVLAPDGRGFYHVARGPEANLSRIVKRDFAGKAEQEIARIGSNNVKGLAISPDGSRLAVFHPSPAGMVILTLPAAGGEVKQVYAAATGPAATPRDVMWSRDGRRLFFLRGFQKSDVVSIPADGGEPQPLGIDLHNFYFLNVHPDGKQIIFADEQWNYHLWVVKNLFPPAGAAR